VIIVEPKPFSEIVRMVSPYRSVLLVGCGSCAAICFAGGQAEAESLGLALRLERRVTGDILRTETVTATRQCDPAFVAPLAPSVARAEAVLSLGCGVGVQQLAQEFPDAEVLPAMNTRFAGGIAADGSWEDRCAMCGDCLLDLTAGICPLARCAKGLLNGPCGGTREDGSCETDAGRPCAWLMIYDRLTRRGRPDLMAVLREPKDWRAGGKGW